MVFKKRFEYAVVHTEKGILFDVYSTRVCHSSIFIYKNNKYFANGNKIVGFCLEKIV